MQQLTSGGKSCRKDFLFNIGNRDNGKKTRDSSFSLSFCVYTDVSSFRLSNYVCYAKLKTLFRYSFLIETSEA